MAALEALEALQCGRDVWVRDRVDNINREADAIYGKRLLALGKESYELQQDLREAGPWLEM